MSEKIITISTSTIFKAILIGLLFWFLFILRDLVLVLLTAIVIASSIEPITRWFVKYKIPRVIAVIFIYFSIAAFLTAVFYFFLPPLLTDLSGILSTIPQYLETVGAEASDANFLGTNNLFGGFPEGLSLVDSIREMRDALTGVSGGVVQSISAIFGGLFSFILIVVISFYLAVQKNGIENFLRLVTPVRHEKYIVGLWERSQRKIGLWMQGQLLLGLIVGVLAYLGLTILGVKYALLLAVFAALFELIPVFGPILSAAPAVLLGFMESVSVGFMVVGLYLIIQQFENHLIYPLVVRKVVGVSPILVIVALIVGAKLAGFLGILLAVPISAALMEFADDVQKEKLAQKGKE